jgi:membrane protease YdiL (CAAX protease family)
MKACTQCGRENEDVLVFCSECGTAFPPPILPLEPPLLAPAFPPLTPLGPRELNGGFATAIFGIYLAAQFGAGLIAGLIVALLSGMRGDSDSSHQMADRLQVIMPLALFLAVLLGGVATIGMSVIFKFKLNDTSPTGAAWVRGSWRDIAKGLITGAIVSVLSLILLLNFGSDFQEEDLGPLTRMSLTTGIPQILWAIVALCFAPPFEELLFRGILYGGYRKSLGAVAAAVLTTFIFVALHFDEFIRQPLAIISITSLALLALWWRLRSGAIGPAIAAHFAYNAVVAATVFVLPSY